MYRPCWEYTTFGRWSTNNRPYGSAPIRNNLTKRPMLYRFLCNGGQQEDVKARPDLASGSFCYVPLHKIWYGIKRPSTSVGARVDEGRRGGPLWSPAVPSSVLAPTIIQTHLVRLMRIDPTRSAPTYPSAIQGYAQAHPSTWSIRHPGVTG